LRRVLLLGAASLVLGACGGGGHSGHDMGSGADGASSVGRPGEAANAGRTIEVRMLDTLRFDPASVNVKEGETVTFRLVNTGQQVHEFDLGDEQFQTEHEKEMQDMGSGQQMADHPNAVSVKPGETRQLTWTFSKRASIVYGCHQPGHYAAGMKGTVAVS
jgi:uncharacterized cupredoxin-like copper-binding protein